MANVTPPRNYSVTFLLHFCNKKCNTVDLRPEKTEKPGVTSEKCNKKCNVLCVTLDLRRTLIGCFLRKAPHTSATKSATPCSARVLLHFCSAFCSKKTVLISTALQNERYSSATPLLGQQHVAQGRMWHTCKLKNDLTKQQIYQILYNTMLHFKLNYFHNGYGQENCGNIWKLLLIWIR